MSNLPLLVCLDRQHSGKPHKLHDMGASFGDLDHNGKPELAEQEAAWTAQYLWAAEMALRQLGYAVMPITDGRYSNRHARANTYASLADTTVYVAAHLNAGGGDYGSVFHDHRSAPGSGPALAKQLAGTLAKACPELARVRHIAASPAGWTSRAYSTISGLRAPIGICYEPAFLDHAAHRPLFTSAGMARIGRALADGIHAWHTRRST